jgi:hypothetical protein
MPWAAVHEDYSEYKYQCSTLPMANVVSPAAGLNSGILNFSKYLLWSNYGEEVGGPGQSDTMCGRIKVSCLPKVTFFDKTKSATWNKGKSFNHQD